MRRFHGALTLTGLALALGMLSQPTPTKASGGGGGGGGGPVFTVKFKGAAINGVVPECEVKVDESQALVGGDTIMTVTVKNVNLPDGTVLGYNLDFDPGGSLVLRGGAGTSIVDLGRFAPGGRDTFGLTQGNTVILGGFL
jgi:hypothetical protein